MHPKVLVNPPEGDCEMTMKGDLGEMSLVDLIQVNCTERNRSCLRIRSRGGEALLYFHDGDIVHAQLGTAEGVDVLYHLLTLTQGSFELEKGAYAPKRTIHESWNGLLLEGMQRIDLARFSPAERQTVRGPEGASDSEIDRSLRALEAEVRSHGSSPAPRDQEYAWRLRELQGVLGAVVTNRQGVVVGHDLDSDADSEGAIASLFSSGGQAIGIALALGEFRHGRVKVAGFDRLVVTTDDLVVGMVTDKSATVDRLFREARKVAEDGP
jgi:predicted regulator of Ras-like GTPase activity (Roadblock/LC7/MglB family)